MVSIHKTIKPWLVATEIANCLKHDLHEKFTPKLDHSYKNSNHGKYLFSMSKSLKLKLQFDIFLDN